MLQWFSTWEICFTSYRWWWYCFYDYFGIFPFLLQEMARKTGTFWKLSIIWNKYFGDSHWNWMNVMQDVCLQLSLKDHTRIKKVTAILDAEIGNKIWEFLATKICFGHYDWCLLATVSEGSHKFMSRWCRLELSTVFERQQQWFVMNAFIVTCLLLCCCPYLIHFAMLSWEIAILLYISYTCWVLKLIFCIQERHLGILWFVFQGYGTRELTFSILKSTFQVKKQYFAVIATYISSAETTFGVESWNSCYILKLHLPFKYEDYIWCLSMQCFDAFCLCVRQSSFIWKAKAMFWKS